MKLIIFLSIIAFTKAVEHRVKTTAELKNALNIVSPGDIIYLADGTYTGTFKITRSGSSASPIILTGSRNAVITSTSYGIHLTANYWVLRGI